jgi:histo-blood group ABO system transferase
MNVSAFCLSKFKKIFFLTLVLTTFCFPQNQKEIRIGLCVMATGKYTCFLEKLFESADRYFLPNYKKTYFVFTDGEVPQCDHLVRIEQKRLGWPHDTLMRFKVYLNSAECFADCDYLFATDADMLFVGEIGDEILGDRVATRPPGYYFLFQPHDDYEKNWVSTAYIPHGQGMFYLAGGFYGGSKKEFIKMITTCAAQVDKDLEHGFIAVWHDESHLNRYFLDNPPTVVLCPAYCFPEEKRWNWLPFAPKLLALDKDYKAFRAPSLPASESVNQTINLLTANHLNQQAIVYVGNTYVENGRDQLVLLLKEGLKKTDYVLEIGCGALVAGIPIMSFLEKGHYFGIEPNKWLIDASLSIEQNRQIADLVCPQFLHNYEFDASKLNIEFDYIISHSIISHAAYWQLPLFLKNCAKVLKPGGKVIFSLRLTEPNKYGNKGAPTETKDIFWQYPGNSYFDKKTVIREASVYFSKIEQKELYTEIITASDKSAFHDWFVLTK